MWKLLTILALLFATPAFAQSMPQAKPTTNGSIVIATGNTYQTALAAVTRFIGRLALTIQNNNASATDNCYITFGVGITAGNATKGKSLKLGPLGSYTRYWPFVPSDEIEATCDTSSDTLYVDTM